MAHEWWPDGLCCTEIVDGVRSDYFGLPYADIDGCNWVALLAAEDDPVEIQFCPFCGSRLPLANE